MVNKTKKAQFPVAFGPEVLNNDQKRVPHERRIFSFWLWIIQQFGLQKNKTLSTTKPPIHSWSITFDFRISTILWFRYQPRLSCQRRTISMYKCGQVLSSFPPRPSYDIFTTKHWVKSSKNFWSSKRYVACLLDSTSGLDGINLLSSLGSYADTDFVLTASARMQKVQTTKIDVDIKGSRRVIFFDAC